MIPFLLLLENLCEKRSSLAELVNPLRVEYPVSGEINFAFESPGLMSDAMSVVRHTLHRLGNPFQIEGPVDGISVRFPANHKSDTGFHRLVPGSWRFNLRESNTEPLLRLNLEAIRDLPLLIEKTEQLSEVLENLGGKRETAFRWKSGKQSGS